MLRKDCIFRTCPPSEAIGMFLTERATKTAETSFIDEDTAQVVTKTQKIILYEIGARVTPQMVAELSDNGIHTVSVCNELRARESETLHGVVPFAVTVTDGASKSAVIIVRSDSTYSAMHLAADYAEDYDNNVFCAENPSHRQVFVIGAKSIGGIHFLSRTQADIEQEKRRLATDPGARRKSPYKVKATWLDIHRARPKRIAQDFVAWGYDIADAKAIVQEYITRNLDTTVEDPDGNTRDTLIIVAATPFRCDAYVPYDICNDYITDSALTLSPDNI